MSWAGGERAAEVGEGGVTIRPGRAEDVPRILPMVRALTDLHQRHDPERFRVRADVLDRYAAWLPVRAADSERSVLLVAEAEGGLVGFLVGTVEPEVPIFWVPECGWIHDVWVEPGHRGSGLAAALVESACARFAAMGQKQVRLHTGAFNDRARALFTQCGFRPCVVEMLRAL
ncbi:MAG: GNAT family N-acetyltransferase [Phycisphaeraceae bacterium]|nr:GNAT family N-acetyltransferase [Phycisphaeraceae bacterium]